MSELSDYEISQTIDAMDRFSRSLLNFVKDVSNNDFNEQLRKAETKLKEYSREEENALKEAEKSVKKAINGSGFFTSSGINRILNKINDDSTRKINSILQEYNNDIKQIYDLLPKIGVLTKRIISFDEKEYSGDNDNLNLDNDEQSNLNDYELPVFELPTFDKPSFEYDESKIEKKSSYGSPKTSGGKLTLSQSKETLEIGDITGDDIEIVCCSKVMTIKANAFRNVDNLKLIVINKGIVSINSNAFRSIPETCIIAFEDREEDIIDVVQEVSSLNNHKVIYEYQDGYENQDDKVSIFAKKDTKPKTLNTSEKNKRIVIRKDTPLDSEEVKMAFLKRNNQYELSIDDLNQGIINAKTNVDKELILYNTLLVFRQRCLNEKNYWTYAKALRGVLKIARARGDIDSSLDIIFGLLFLSSSGSMMLLGKYTSYKEEPERLCYHPQLEIKDLREIIQEKNISRDELNKRYALSPFVIELNDSIKDSYYSVESSIKLMNMALDCDPFEYFFPAKSGIIRS